MPLVEALRPPVKTGGRANEVGTGLEGDTAGGLGILQVVDRGEMPIGQRGVGEWPEMFSGLQFWGVGWQKQQVEVIRHT